MVKIKYVRPDLSEGSYSLVRLERQGISVSQYREEIEPFVRDLAIDYELDQSSALPVTNWRGKEREFVFYSILLSAGSLLEFLNYEQGLNEDSPSLNIPLEDIVGYRRYMMNKTRVRDLERTDSSTAIKRSYPKQSGYLRLTIPEHRNSPKGIVFLDEVRRVVPEGSTKRFRPGLFNLLD